jgi:hypothetical protein
MAMTDQVYWFIGFFKNNSQNIPKLWVWRVGDCHSWKETDDKARKQFGYSQPYWIYSSTNKDESAAAAAIRPMAMEQGYVDAALQRAGHTGNDTT